MAHKETRPDPEYYDRPYVPNTVERDEWRELPLRPIEALTLLVNNADTLSESDRRALRIIIDNDDWPDGEVDMFQFSNED